MNEKFEKCLDRNGALLTNLSKAFDIGSFSSYSKNWCWWIWQNLRLFELLKTKDNSKQDGYQLEKYTPWCTPGLHIGSTTLLCLSLKYLCVYTKHLISYVDRNTQFPVGRSELELMKLRVWQRASLCGFRIISWK